MKTYMPNPQTVERKWWLVDANGMTLGRLASEVAAVLRGKNKPTYVPHVDCGDFVIVTNTDKIKLTGKKLTQKYYRHHTGWIGNMKEMQYKDVMEQKSDFALQLAVKGMLPKTNAGRNMLKRLKMYKGAEHMNEAQKPEVLNIKGGKR